MNQKKKGKKMIEIEKNIKAPSICRETKYPFRKMEVGDSFFIPTENRNSISVAANTYAKKNNVKFSIRMDEKDGVIGHRCFRVS